MKIWLLIATTFLALLYPAQATQGIERPTRWSQETHTQTQFLQENNPAKTEPRKVSAYVIPIHGEISKPQVFVLRRGLKEAIRQDIDAIILDIDTPGGSLGTMLEMMEMLDKFEGTKFAFINDEAISAGSFIAITTDYIYFSPKGRMGSAAAVNATGSDVGDTMSQKLNSYLDATVRMLTSKHRYRADVQRAMMKADYELRIDGKLISPKGELLTLTAEEAVQTYGQPPAPLLAEGIVNNPQELLTKHYGDFKHQITTMELAFAEGIAKWLTSLAPLLLGVGGLLLFVEFKSPGFGIFGIAGLAMVGLVFIGHYIAGVAGHEPILIFFIGAVLVLIELFVMPGVIIAGVLGMLMMLGSLIWGMTDIWPGDTIGTIDGSLIQHAVLQIIYAMLITVGLTITLAKVLPRSWFFDKLILSAKVGHHGDAAIDENFTATNTLPALGSRGVTVTKMFPSGEIEIDNKRFLARVETGLLEAGTPVEVVGHRAFQLIVKSLDS